MELILRNRFFLTLAVYAGLVSMAFAQPPGGGPPGGGRGGPGGPRGGGGGGMGGLLRSDEVREELGLTDDQVEELSELQDSMREEMRGRMRERFQGGERGGRRGGRGEAGGGGGRPDRGEMQAVFEEFRKEAEAKLAEVLTSQQMDRLKQINLQQQVSRGGARALMNGQLAEALDLSDDQMELLRERAQEVRAEMEQKIATAREEANAQLMDVLTSEQKAKLEEMTGEPFTLSEPQGGRGGRGAGRGGRPGPPEGGGRGGRGGEGRGGRPGPPPRD